MQNVVNQPLILHYITHYITHYISTPMSSSALTGWAANSRQAEAILVLPAQRTRPITALRMAAITWGEFPQCTWDLSSPKTTSLTQWDLFSICLNMPMIPNYQHQSAWPCFFCGDAFDAIGSLLLHLPSLLETSWRWRYGSTGTPGSVLASHCNLKAHRLL